MHCVGYQTKSMVIGVCCVRTLQCCLPKLALYPYYVIIISWKHIKFGIRIGVSFLKILKTPAGNPSRKPLDFWCCCLDPEPDVGSQCMGCNSTSSLVSLFGALVMKNRVVGSQCRANGSQTRSIMRAGSQRRVICRAESQCRAKEARKSGTVSPLTTLLGLR